MKLISRHPHICQIAAACLLLAVLVMAAPVPSAGAAWPGRDGTVLYRDLDPGPEAEGWEASGLARFTPRPISRRTISTDPSDAAPQASPDGRLIVFSRGIEPGPDSYPTASAIFVMDADSGAPRQLTRPGPDTDDLEPSFDASGHRVLFVRLGDETVRGTNQGDIMSVDLQGLDLRALTSGPAADRSPAASPRGRQIVFVRARAPLPGGGVANATHVFSIRPDGSRLRDLTPGLKPSVPAADPDFSPNGRTIALTVGSRSAAEIYTMRANGARLRPLTGRGAHAAIHGYGYSEPSFSPRGDRLIATAINSYNTEPALIELSDPDSPRRFEFGGEEPFWAVAPPR